MNTERHDRLVARVNAVNKANAYGMELHTQLTAIFAPFVGTKIEKVDGTLLAKVKNLLPPFPSTPALHVYRQTSNYSLVYVVKTCELIPPHGCIYADTSVYIGEMDVSTLVKLSDKPVFRTDYTVEEVQANRAAYEAAKKLASEAESKLFPFGEVDR